MENRKLKPGEIVQIAPNPNNSMFDYCLMIVTEPKSFGAQGYVKNAGSDGQVYIRLTFEQMEPTGGFAEWVAQ